MPVAHPAYSSRPAYRVGMTPHEVSELLESLPGVKRKGSTEQPAWYVHDRLVARLVELAWEMQRH